MIGNEYAARAVEVNLYFAFTQVYYVSSAGVPFQRHRDAPLQGFTLYAGSNNRRFDTIAIKQAAFSVSNCKFLWRMRIW